MRFPNYLKAIQILLVLIVSALFITGCNTKTKICLPFPMIAPMNPNISFRIVDKTTGHDLFFGGGAPYKLSQLKFSHILNGQPDTVFLMTDTLDRFFNIRIPPSQGPVLHYVDTVTMQIANKPQDVFLFNTKDIVGPCSITRELASVSFDGKVVYTQANGPQVAVLTK
jgi:hypothetical protein